MLELDAATVVFQVINFAILAALLYWLLFKPMTKAVQERAQKAEGLTRELERERQAASLRRAELDEALSRSDEETANALVLAREEAAAERAELLRDTKAEVEQILVEAQVDARNIRRQAIETFDTDLVNAILDISGTVIRNTAPSQVHDSLIKQVSDHIWELGRTDIQRVEAFRRSLGEREPTAHITTANSFTLEQRGLMARTFTALADRHVNLDVRVDPKLVAGVHVRIGDIIVDSSIAGQMNELHDRAMSALREQIANE